MSKKKVYTCNKCNESFTENFILVCHHICLNCLQSFVDDCPDKTDTLTFTCPVCNSFVDISNDVFAFEAQINGNQKTEVQLKKEYSEYRKRRDPLTAANLCSQNTSNNISPNICSQNSSNFISPSICSQNSSNSISPNICSQNAKEPIMPIITQNISPVIYKNHVHLFEFNDRSLKGFSCVGSIPVNDFSTINFKEVIQRIDSNLANNSSIYGYPNNSLVNCLYEIDANSKALIFTRNGSNTSSNDISINVSSNSIELTFKRKNLGLKELPYSGVIISFPGISHGQFYTVERVKIEGLESNKKYIISVTPALLKPTVADVSKEHVNITKNFQWGGKGTLISFETKASD